MSRLFMGFLLTLLVSCSTTPKKLEKPFLWEAKRGDQTISLFGTVHKGVSLEQVPISIKDKIKRADVIYLEANVSGIKEKQTKSVTLLAKKYYKKNPFSCTGFQKKLSKTAQRNVAYMLSHPVFIELVPERMRLVYIKDLWKDTCPAFIESVLFNDIIGKNKFEAIHPEMFDSLARIGYERQKSSNNVFSKEMLDGQIQKLAKTYKIQLRYLDNIKDLPMDYSKMTVEEFGIQRIEQIFGNKHKQVNNFINTADDIIDYYYDGDLVGIFQEVDKMAESDKEISLYKRNRTWVEKLTRKSVKSEKSFAAVGVAHFVGKNNLIDLLQKEGYTVRRVMSK